jgi:hypothetical protein
MEQGDNATSVSSTIRKYVLCVDEFVHPEHCLPVLVLLHRAFYANALIQHGDDLCQSEYYYSVQAILRSARDTLSWAEAIIHQSPAMCARLYWIWSILVTSTVSR